MNYEDMLKNRDGAAVHKEQMFLGTFYRKQLDKKLHNIVELRPELADSLVISDGLRRDQQASFDFTDKHQLHYELHQDSGGIYELEIEQGNLVTLAQLLDSNPAVVTEKGFIDRIVGDLMTVTEKLNEQGIYQLCFDPRCIFLRKGDSAPLLLCHGSSFLAYKNQALLYSGFEQSVAPEVLAGGHADVRSDVFALGKLVEKLFESGGMTYEYKRMVSRATADIPEQRFQSIAEMRSSLTKTKGMKRTLITFLAAVAMVAILLFIYFDLVPESANIEFIDENGLRPSKDPFNEIYEDTSTYDATEYLDPDVAAYLDSVPANELSDAEWDSVVHITNVEKIFNERFSRMAEQKLGRIYSAEQMGGSQSDFIANSQAAISELMEYARTEGRDCGLTPDQASTLADQIIGRIQAQKQGGITRFGSMTKSSDDE